MAYHTPITHPILIFSAIYITCGPNITNLHSHKNSFRFFAVLTFPNSVQFFQMMFQRITVRKSFRTKIAVVRFLARMNSHMNINIVFCVKFLIAYAALKRTLAGVHSHVSL